MFFEEKKNDIQQRDFHKGRGDMVCVRHDLSLCRRATAAAARDDEHIEKGRSEGGTIGMDFPVAGSSNDELTPRKHARTNPNKINGCICWTILEILLGATWKILIPYRQNGLRNRSKPTTGMQTGIAWVLFPSDRVLPPHRSDHGQDHVMTIHRSMIYLGWYTMYKTSPT